MSSSIKKINKRSSIILTNVVWKVVWKTAYTNFEEHSITVRDNAVYNSWWNKKIPEYLNCLC